MHVEGTTERVLRLLGLLQRRTSWTAAELAAEVLDPPELREAAARLAQRLTAMAAPPD